MSKGNMKNSVRKKPQVQAQKAKRQMNVQPFLYGIIFIFSFLLYGNTIPNNYALDDDFVIQNNKMVHMGIKGIPEIFTSRYSDVKGGTFGYRPITKSTLAIEYQFFGENPHVSHFINILLYALTGMFLFFLLKKLLKAYPYHLPFIITLLFLAHPIHTEVVASIKNREEILSFLGGLASLHFAIRYFEKRNLLNILLSVLFFIFGILSKLSILTFIAVIPLITFFFIDETKKYSFFSQLNKIAFSRLSAENLAFKNTPTAKEEKSSIVPEHRNELIKHNQNIFSRSLSFISSESTTATKQFIYHLKQFISNILVKNIFIILALVINLLTFKIYYYQFNNLILVCIALHFFTRTSGFPAIRKLLLNVSAVIILLSFIFILLGDIFNGMIRVSFQKPVMILALPVLIISSLLMKYNTIDYKLLFKKFLSQKILSRYLKVFIFVYASVSIIFFFALKLDVYFFNISPFFIKPIVVLLILITIQYAFALKNKITFRTYFADTKYILFNIWAISPISQLFRVYDILKIEKNLYLFKLSGTYNAQLREDGLLFSVIITIVIINRLQCKNIIYRSFKFLWKHLIKSNFILELSSRTIKFILGNINPFITRVLLKSILNTQKKLNIFSLRLAGGMVNFTRYFYRVIMNVFSSIPLIYKRIAIIISLILIVTVSINLITTKYLKKEDARLYQWQNPLFREKVVDVIKADSSGIKKPNTLTVQKVVVTSQNKSLEEKIKLGSISFGFYLKKLIFPYPLLFYYGYNMFPYDKFSDLEIILPIIAFILLLITALLTLRKKSIISFSILFFFITLSMFLNLAAPITGIVGERLVYIPSLAFSMATAYLLYSFSSVKRLRLAAKNRINLLYVMLLIILVPYSLISMNRNKSWKDMLTLMDKDIPHLRNSAMANVIYASVLQNEYYKSVKLNVPDIQFADNAVIHYKRALEVYPFFHNSWNNLGTIYSDVYKKYTESIPFFINALKYKPDYTEACFNLAYNYERVSKNDSAFYYYNKTLSMDSVNIKCISYMANLYFATGDTTKAFYWNSKIMKLDTLSDIPYIDLGNYYFHLNIIPKAIYYWEAAFQKNQGNYGLCMNLATYYKQTGNVVKADFYYSKANQAQNR